MRRGKADVTDAFSWLELYQKADGAASAAGLRSTALTRTSAGDAAAGTSGGSAGWRRLRNATTTATAAAISSAVPKITITSLFILRFSAVLLPYHHDGITSVPYPANAPAVACINPERIRQVRRRSRKKFHDA